VTLDGQCIAAGSGSLHLRLVWSHLAWLFVWDSFAVPFCAALFFSFFSFCCEKIANCLNFPRWGAKQTKLSCHRQFAERFTTRRIFICFPPKRLSFCYFNRSKWCQFGLDQNPHPLQAFSGAKNQKADAIAVSFGWKTHNNNLEIYFINHGMPLQISGITNLL